MGLIIRPAESADASDVTAVKQWVWPDEVSKLKNVVGILGGSDHITLVADLDGIVVGFVDGFLTTSVTGEARWEVDLLVVHPQYQGRGIATRLIFATTAAGRTCGASTARGLVGIDNIASQRAFAHCGYTRSDRLYALYISMGANRQVHELHTQAHRITVTTLNYHGLWLEGNVTSADFAAAQALCHQQRLDLVGAVLSSSEQSLIEAAQKAGFDFVGNFHWWQLDLHEA